ncbi:hypothetical protein AJ79_00575 [Helicocarpus griseus UAMH5409]|uniref:Cytochrome P450 monooxygenase n=1 Tax=Helicocarpus griseus UAMH5409 TaxID=1447875 RepID=A0A2B7Y9N3_9EURO|nr:hypothetical protein AJ79_00575 [Helicocarpus griseus UAMH5409]
MSVKQFYFVGDEPTKAQSASLDLKGDLKAARQAVASVLHVADPSGISFHYEHDELEKFQDIYSCEGPIGVRIDGQPVQEVQGPEGLPIVGSFYEIFPDHLGNHARLFRKYGSVIKTTNMGKTTYLTESPEVAACALAESAYFTKKINSSHPLWGVKDNTAIFIGDTETENWRLAHKYLPPSMSPKAVRHYTPLMQDSVRDSFSVFDALDEQDKSFNAYQYMVKLASQTIGKFSLNMDLGHFKTVDSPLHPVVTDIANLLSLNKKITARGEWYRWLPFGDPQRLRAVQKSIYTLLQEAIDNVAKDAGPDLPMQEASLQASCVVDYLLRATDDQGAKLPPSLILANMLIVTGAGFTTTSALLSWCLYSLVTYPGMQERLLQELIDNNISNETTWTPELVNSLPFLDKFIKETQRLHNPSFQPGRTTKTEVVVPGGYRLPADAVIIPAIMHIHTNPKVWRDPLRFEPDRWDTEEVKKRHRCAYVPFATGPRGCIGFNFALQEVKILISELVYRYDFEREGLESIEYDPEFQLIRPLNFYLRAKRRTEWPEKS